MQGSEGEGRPYSYRRVFSNSAVTSSAPDMDKDALEAYIRSVLGVKDPNKESTS